MTEGAFEVRPLHIPPTVDMDLLVSACNRVRRRWPLDGVSRERDPEAIAEHLRRRVANNDWRGATVAELLRSARVVFASDYRTRENLRGVRKFLYDEMRVATRLSLRGGMLSVYLASFVPNAGHTTRFAGALAAAPGDFGARWKQLLEALPEILSPKSAHRSIGTRMTRMDDPWRELRAMGLDDPHAPGLMEHAQAAYLEQMAGRLRQREGIDHVVRWLKPEGRDARRSGAAQALQAILSPWLRREPTDDLRQHLVDQLVGLYGDPRTAQGTAWDAVRPEHRELIHRWLTGENIRFFLDAVSAVEDNHMWAPRREFWLGLYEEGRIDAAWVAFSPAASRWATDRAVSRGERSAFVFGEQTAGGGRRNTSLLLLKIGNCIVVEGSHSYKVHLFRSSNSAAPRLFRPKYDCEGIRFLPGSETVVHNSGWQPNVLEKLAYMS